MRRKILLALAVLILAAGAAFWWWSRPLPVLNVVTWPGLYGRAQAAAQIQAYRSVKRVDARIQQWAENGTLEELRRTVAAGHADVVDLELPLAVAACKAGLLEPIDAASLPPGADGTAADRDFHKGMVGPCFVASAVYAQMIVCKPCQGAGVTDAAGLFALVASGEKIGLPRHAKVTLEMALLADGAKPDQVYALLATEAGVARAFARLDTIKPNIVWGAGIPALARGDVAIAAALTAEVQAAPDATPFPVQFYEADVLAVPRGTARKDLALDYLRFATGSAPLAEMVKFAPYMPPRKSSMGLVEKLPASPTRDFVVSQKGMIETSFAIDDAFWAEHGTALEARFRAWADAS
jgi:putative spermidine/putrescine transport system substrate-binding protein